jgi:hypothetical protein
VAPAAIPPATLVGLNVRAVSVGGSTVSLTIFGAEFSICAEICTEGGSATTFGFMTSGYVCTMNVADVAPAWTTVPGGTAAIADLLLLNVTFKPADGAGAFRASVPVTIAPPVTLFGLSARLMIS